MTQKFVTVELPVELIERLKKMASQTPPHDSEDFNPAEYSGGNFDDAYWTGYEGGLGVLAQELSQYL